PVAERFELTVDGELEALGHGGVRSSENLRVYANRPSPPRISRLSPTSGYPAPGTFRILSASCASERHPAWPRPPSHLAGWRFSGSRNLECRRPVSGSRSGPLSPAK